MPTVDLRTPTGATNGTVELDDRLFGVEPNVPVMHQVVTAQLAAARRGTSKTRTRGEVSGGGAKPWRQKGTGRARQGSIRAPHWTGGGIAHGPTGERNHTKRVNKKLKQLALRSALSDRAASGDVVVVEEIGLETPSTKQALAILDALGIADRRVLLVLARLDVAAIKSFRNLPAVHILTVDQLNTYDVLASDVVLFEQAALDLVGTGQRLVAATAGTDADGEEDEEA